ncbi:MAG: hypothetical protein LBD51_08555 [Bifidobacteriaceae bacterium]|jgi:hypothetical protein|nr:hypothetical protein [Bifidobacteriaceae bacterium]
MSPRGAAPAPIAGTPGGVLAGRPPLPAVNLLPPSVGQARESRALQVKLIVGLVAAVVVLAAGYVGLTIWKGAAYARVEAATQEATRLAEEKKQYDELIAVEQDLADAQDAKVAATAYEIKWPEMFQAMVDTRPEGSVVNNISGNGMSASSGLSSSSNVLARPAVGRMTMVLTVPSLQAAAQWVETLNATSGLESAGYQSLSRQVAEDGTVAYKISCSADINLLGLTGKSLPEEFREWQETGGSTGAEAEEE